MKDKLKNYSYRHRQDFEIYHIDADMVWSAVQSGLERVARKGKNGYWKHAFKVAAILIVLFSLGYGYYLNKQRIEIDRYGVALHDLSIEMADTEAYYTMKIVEKLEMIRIAGGIVDVGLLAQLEVLDEDYRSLKKDLMEDADNEEVINAMIGHYLLKLQMLEKILMEIQKDDDQKKEQEV